MFRKKDVRNDYEYATNYLKDIIVNLVKNNDYDFHEIVIKELEATINNIDEEANKILRGSFLTYCVKKNLDPCNLLSSYESRGVDHRLKNLKSEELLDNYNFIKLTTNADSLLNLSQALNTKEFKKIEAWQKTKTKYMQKHLIQKYKDIEGAYELINALLQHLYKA